jgi:hypothetical protein
MPRRMRSSVPGGAKAAHLTLLNSIPVNVWGGKELSTVICAVFDPAGRPRHPGPGRARRPLPPSGPQPGEAGRARVRGVPGEWVSLCEVGWWGADACVAESDAWTP